MSALEDFIVESTEQKQTENKRYYWLKLPVGFFVKKEIKKLRRIPGGDTYTVIYLKMLLASLENNGRLYYEGIEDDFASELALDIDEDVEAVKITIHFLMANNILFQNNVTEYELMTAHEMTGSETASTRRSRKSRAAAKLLQAQNSIKMLQCNSDATERNTEIEIDKSKR